MALTETIELLGKGLYTDIPDVLTLKSIPTASELDYVSGENFDQTMLEVILPQAVEEKIDFKKLLEIDYNWVLRCLRILNYGPFHTTNAIFCGSCGKTSYGEFSVNLNSIACKTLPEGFVNDITIGQDEFVDFTGDIHICLPTIQKMLNSEKDQAFVDRSGKSNRELARICYMIKSFNGKTDLTPVELKMKITGNLSDADYKILRTRVNELTDYGLRAGGRAPCPKCGNSDGAFIALVDDRFFRPTVGDLRQWKISRNTGSEQDVPGGPDATV